jgi:transmembrane sensor
MNAVHKVDEELITKYLAGEALPEEAMALHDWVAKSEDNKRMFLQLERAWNLGNDAHVAESYDKEPVWKNLSALSEQLPLREKRNSYFTLSRMAAAVALLFISGWVIYSLTDRKDRPSNEFIVSKTKVTILDQKLPDSTRVVLNRFSQLTFSNNFSKSVREVSLVGECYFDVAHKPDQPFIVTVDDIKIKVLGTAFNVKEDSTLSIVETLVTRGVVMMYNINDSLIIRAGESGVYDKTTKNFKLLSNFDVNNVGYATGKFEFSDTSLKDIAIHLEKVFGVKIYFENPRLQACRMSSTFENNSLEFILKILSATLNITYEIKGNTVNIAGNDCQ